MTADSIETRVARGAALLDEKLPGWHLRIDLERLDLRSGCNCILGQTWDGDVQSKGFFNPFWAHVDALFGGVTSDDDVTYGFNAEEDDEDAEDDEYEELTHAWRHLILARRAVSETPR